MVDAEDFVYDDNGVGDGNLTEVVVHPGNGQADRVTEYAYDWRDRVVVSKEGIEQSEDTATNRPITYQILNNLGEVVELDTYDGDGVSLASLGSTGGVPNAPAASLLRSQTTTAYDEQGRIYQTSDKVVDQTTGEVLSSQTTNYWYDHRGQLIKTELANGSVTKSQYDGAGRLVVQATTDGGGDTSWADAGNLTGDTILSETNYQYDANGNQTAVRDALDNTTSYTYDSLNRLTSQTDAEDATTTYAYDEAGNLHSLTDADGNTTTWSYDLLGRCLEETNPLGDHEYYSYDPSGRLLSKTDYDGRTTTYTYDGLGRETAENWLDSSQNVIQSFGYSYDLVGDLLSESDPAASYSYAYNVLGRSTTITQSIAGLTPTVTLAQQFDADGDRTQLSATIGQTADFMNNYAYNGLGQMTQVTQSGATGGDAVAEKRIDISYDAAGQFNTVSRYADLAGTELVAESDYTYDLAGQLTALDHHQGTTDLENYTWTYDQAGNMTASTSSLDGAVSYSNDATGQLTGADYDYQTNESYTYDATGNRTNTGYTTGTGNRLLSDGTYTYTYNAEGNRTAKFIDTNADGVWDSGDTDVTTYTWDYRDRLTEVDHFAAYGDQADQVVKYTYDYANRLVGRSLDANGDGTVDSSTAYVYDGNQIALQFDHAGTGAATASDLSHRYLWGPAVDQLLADEQMSPLQPDQGEGFDQSTPGNVVWPLTDNLGTIRDLATYDSNSGVTSIANHRVYDAYGNLTSQTNSAVDCVFGYTGKMLDDATGLQNNVNRWYDAKIGRLTSNDPIGADVTSTDTPITAPLRTWTQWGCGFGRGLLPRVGILTTRSRCGVASTPHSFLMAVARFSERTWNWEQVPWAWGSRGRRVGIPHSTEIYRRSEAGAGLFPGQAAAIIVCSFLILTRSHPTGMAAVPDRITERLDSRVG